MNVSKRPLDDQDPDYVSSAPSNAKQQKIYEETARINTAKKITEIVEKEFAKEIDNKEKEVLDVQNRLQKALKTLHLLRYVVITDFYNRKHCQAPQTSETKQSQIHPSVKSLIGKTCKHQKIGVGDPGPSTSDDFLSIPESSQADNSTRIKTEPQNTRLLLEVNKRLGQDVCARPEHCDKTSSKLELVERNEIDYTGDGQLIKKVPRYIPPRSSRPMVASPSRGERHKVKKRIVLGNISKWIPPDWREDGASHKWMMYVRGSKDMPNIDSFVSKIRFFLHPSYQPNDVVEVTSSPFHLSRRGWGEFPLRVQLHFKNMLDKPMDIIHYLKLDRTYTGLQTLGSETVVDIWIHASSAHHLKNNVDSNTSIDTNSQQNDDKIEMDLSPVKTEYTDSFASCEQRKIKLEPTDGSFPESNLPLIDDRCIKIEHNYVSKASSEYRTEIIDATGNNVTIRHSPLQAIKKCSSSNLDSTTNTHSLETNPVGLSLNEMEGGEDEHVDIFPHYVDNYDYSQSHTCNGIDVPHNSVLNEQVIGNLSIIESSVIEDDALSNTSTNPKNVQVESTVVQSAPKMGTVISSELTVQEVSVPMVDARDSPKGILRIIKDARNGGVLPIPIKLVKRNDKFCLATNITKLQSGKIELVKSAESDMMNNLIARQFRSAKVALQGHVEARSSKFVAVKQIGPSKLSRIELLHGNARESGESKSIAYDRNVFEHLNSRTEVSDAPSRLSTLFRNKCREPDLKRLASCLQALPSKSEPLKIVIPPTFEPIMKKQIVLVKDNQLISVNAPNPEFSASKQSVLQPMRSHKSQEAVKNSVDMRNDPGKSNRGQISLLNVILKPSEGTSILKPSISILKKPIINNCVGQQKTSTVLKMNSSNSLFINSNCNIPVLQIASPLQTLNVDGKNPTRQSRLSQPKLDTFSKNIKLDTSGSCKTVKMKVTIGKDKHKILSKRDTYEETLRSIDTIQLKSLVDNLSYIMKRIPLVTQDATDFEYRQIYPHACATREEFFNLNIGKQRAHEWHRAKMARSLLRKKGFRDDELWSVKEILYWARHHGYTPMRSSLTMDSAAQSSKTSSQPVTPTLTTCSEPILFNEWLEISKYSNNYEEESDIEVDVVRIDDEKLTSEVKVEPIDKIRNIIYLELSPNLQLACTFVSETAKEIGIRLQTEEVIPDVMHRAAERCLVQAVQCLIDDLIRRSLSKAWQRNSIKCPNTIKVDDVRRALLSRIEFDVFTNDGLGSLQSSDGYN